MEAKRWSIPIARTGLSIKRSKELLLLCRFLDAGNKEVPHAQPTGVQKAPRHEVAGSSAPAEQRALRGFVRGARLRKFEEWRPRPRAQLKRYGTIVAK